MTSAAGALALSSEKCCVKNVPVNQVLPPGQNDDAFNRVNLNLELNDAVICSSVRTAKIGAKNALHETRAGYARRTVTEPVRHSYGTVIISVHQYPIVNSYDV